MTITDFIRIFYLSIRNPVLIRPIFSDFFGLKQTIKSNSIHLGLAAKWLKKSQLANKDGGSASHYEVHGWLASFPETTGYIIPTLLDFADYSGQKSFEDVSIKMGDFLLKVQLENGAFQAGNMSSKDVKPSVFNTGQVLFGLCRLYVFTKDDKYKIAAKRAGDWLCEIQDEDGCWRRGLTPYADQIPHVYNTRTAWALLKLYEIQEDEKYLLCNEKNISWALTQKNEHHWFKSNSFFENESPYTHTIAYALRGILESGIYLKNNNYIDEVRASIDNMLPRLSKNGTFGSRLDENWQSRDKSSCLTGNLQISIILGLLYKLDGNQKYKDAMLKINDSHKQFQMMGGSRKILGAMKGSHPFWGVYCPYSFPNWTTKFYMDALLIEEGLDSIVQN